MSTKPVTLVIDIGNTSTSLALARSLRISSVRRTPSMEPALNLSTVPRRAVIASVKPDVNKRWER
jgi:pantothenate kinase type III